jgi:hypothetical protein
MRLLQRLVQRGADIFERDSLSWGLSFREALIIAVVPVMIMLGMVAIVPTPDLFVWITAEDSAMEWLQFLLIFASSLIFARLSLRLFQGRQSMLGLFCLIMTLGALFVAGEEIAWGQHIFGWSTPEALEALNVQQETTLHNISGAHPVFIYAVMLAGLYGTLVPLLKSLWWNRQNQSLFGYLLVPALCLVPAFFMPFGYRFSRLILGVDALFPRWIFQITKFSEVTELCLYFGVVVFAWLNLRRIEGRQPSQVRRVLRENDFTP